VGTLRADFKSPARVVNPLAGLAKTLAEGRCRLCGNPYTTRHHLVSRSLRGDDIEANLVPLCGSGVTGCHGAVEARDPMVCSLLRSRLTDDELSYVLKKKGADWLERYYPEGTHEGLAR
jgi:hypothetical protein